LDIINIDIYDLFLEHGSECLWRSDSRLKRPKNTNETTDKMFYILESIDHNIAMISSGVYSNKMELKFQQEIEVLKPKISKEVLAIIEIKYKN
jgi:hypothetical protein